MSTNNPHRRSIRLKDYNYSSAGAYFVTVCTLERKCIFGEIMNGQNQLSSIGQISKSCWLEIPNHFQNSSLDEFVIMPNHIHGVVLLADVAIVGAGHVQPLNEQIHASKYKHLVSKSLSSIIGSFKSSVTRICKQRQLGVLIWQRNYYEHIIRNERELNRVREYIINNPLHWKLDRENQFSDNFNLGHDKYFGNVYLKTSSFGE